MTTYRTARIYDDPSAADGIRVLADRLWPRGLSKDKASIDLWAKDVTPSNELRAWYHAHPDRFEEFAERYRVELDDRQDDLREIRSAGPIVTLLTARKDVENSHLTVLLAVLTQA